MSDSYPDDWESRRRAVLHRSNYQCEKCGTSTDDDVLHVDHVVPISEGGGHEINNLQTLCPDCHAEKHDENRCHICHKIGHHPVDESKTSGTVGITYLCREHFRELANRHGNHDKTHDKGSFGNPKSGVCIFCGCEASGKYAVHDHGVDPRKANINSVMCSDCRSLYVFENGPETREELQRRMVRFEGATEVA